MLSMLPGVGMFGSTPTIKCLVPILQTHGFRISAIWASTIDEAKSVAYEFNIEMYTEKINEVYYCFLHLNVVILCNFDIK